ncbi:MAG: hypothetical protein SCJ94_06800 [Bacillota bacterium]|nr:hypothetical protein [Bacillota bacterium]
MTTKPDIKKNPALWEPGQQHPKKKPRELDSFSERVRRKQEQEKPGK